MGQGAIGIEARADDARTREMLARIDHADTSTAVACERAFLAVLDGSCKTPIGGHATLSGEAVHFRGLIAQARRQRRARNRRSSGGRKDAVTIGADAGRALKRKIAPAPGFFD